MKSRAKNIQIVIAILIMFVAGYFIPTWGPVTRMGVQYFCVLVGWIYMCILLNHMLLPSALVLTALLVPGYYTPAKLVATTFGNTITILMIFIFILVYIFQQTKTGEYIVRWILSRKIIQGRPYLFTAFFLLSVIVIGGVIGSFGIILLVMALLTGIIEVSGIRKDDDWVRFILISTVALSGSTEVFYPFKPYSILYMGIFDQQLAAIGTSCDGNAWLITSVIMALFSFIILMLGARFLFHFDLTELEGLDVSKIQTDEFKKINKKQIIVLTAVFVSFFYPFLQMLIPSGTSFYALANNVGQYFFMVAVVALLCLITVDGEPIADISDVFKNGVNWAVILGVAAALAIGGALAANESGVSEWLLSIFSGIFDNMNIIASVIIIGVACCVVTQFFSNSATAIIFLTALAPLSVVLSQKGINVAVLAALIGTSTLTACLLPSGSGQSAMTLGSDLMEGTGQKWVLSKGIIILVLVGIAEIIGAAINILIL